MDIFHPELDFRRTFILPERLKEEILINAAFYRVTDGPFRNTFDIVSYFVHSNGQRYGIVCTHEGVNNKARFATTLFSICNHNGVCVSSIVDKRECVRAFLIANGCSMDYVYNILD